MTAQEEGKVKLTSSKTGKTRELPIKESIVHLKRWKQEWAYPDVKDDDLVFPARARDSIMTTAGLNVIIKKNAQKAGIKRNITAYDFRHTRLTDIYNQGVRGFDHNLFAGHKKGSKQTATYVKTDEEEMFKAMLERVYHVEELSPEKKVELEKEIEALKQWKKETQDFISKEISEMRALNQKAMELARKK